MNYLLVIPRALWKVLFLFNFVLGLIILYPLFYIFLSKKKWFPIAFRLQKFWARWILFVPGLFVKIKRHTPESELPNPAVYCANHASYLDIVINYIVVPHYFVSMGKREIEKAPLFNIFFKEMNILVDRKSNSDAHKAFIRAGEEIDKGHSVFIFPEGGISSSGKLLNCKNGVFKLAIEKQVPVVPITYLNNWKLLQNGGFFKSNGRPGISRVIIHEPISTNGMTENDLVFLRTKVRDILLKDLSNYNSHYIS
jgi:1-acyl-sn-glycerol-3-phosphate acyltransferase